jgi:protocatechuate 3,4-dioxygenase beta subunit
VPPWDAVPSCAVNRTDRAGQGPFYIHNGERDDDIDLIRQDIRGRYNPDAEPGTQMHLHLRVLSAGSEQCGTTPLADAEVYVWHCDAQGFYSGFGNPGDQTPDLPYRFRPGPNDLKNNTRFLRGIGISDANGVVSFRSIFPGWYNGRDIHVHMMVLKRGSQQRARVDYRGGDHLYTTQLYFEPELIDRVHKAAEPYLRRTQLPAYAGCILGDERGASGLRMKASFTGELVTAQMQLVVDPAQSRA